MANINVNITELYQVLEATPAEHNLMLVGNHGIGKSEILTDYFSKQGIPVIALFLGQMSDPGDLIGLPTKDEKTGKTDFIPPYWFPTDGKPIILFLDELNRALPEILQTIMDLALNRKLAGKLLPKGSRIISAVNEGDQYQLTDLDPALVSRFNIINFRPSVEEWLLWAKKNEVDNRVLEFIEENKLWLDQEPDSRQGADTGLGKTPDRRAWKRVSDIIRTKRDLKAIDAKIISSVVGPKAAAAFISSISANRIISAKEVLKNFKSEKVQKKLKDYQLHELSLLNEALYRHIETEAPKPSEQPVFGENLMNYFDYLTKHNKEAAAHFTNLYVKGTYPNTVQFIATKCGVMAMLLISYVKGIK